jgi:hypothetical protein
VVERALASACRADGPVADAQGADRGHETIEERVPSSGGRRDPVLILAGTGLAEDVSPTDLGEAVVDRSTGDDVAAVRVEHRSVPFLTLAAGAARVPSIDAHMVIAPAGRRDQLGDVGAVDGPARRPSPQRPPSCRPGDPGRGVTIRPARRARRSGAPGTPLLLRRGRPAAGDRSALVRSRLVLALPPGEVAADVALPGARQVAGG